MRSHSWKTVLVLGLLVLGVGWGSLKYWNRPIEPLVTFANTTGGILKSAEGRVSSPGSMAVVARAPVVFRVYLIEEGEQVLKETIRFDPKDEASLYFSLCVTSQEGAALVIHDHPSGERQPIYRAVSFPMPVSMGSGDCYGKVDPYGGAKPGVEYSCFVFCLSWTDHGSPLVGSMDDMKHASSSKERSCSYLAVTCEKM